MAPFDRTCECDEGDAWVTDHVSDACMIEIKHLEHAVGQSGLLCCPADPLRDERGLLRVLEHDCVTRDQRRHQSVDGRQPWIVPRCDHEDDAQRFTSDIAGEAVTVFEFDIRERVRCEVDHRSPS